MLTVLAVWTAVASLFTATAYARDKWLAKRGRRRISEQTLLVLSLAGGWPGGLAASRWLRHKTSKRSYRVKFAIAVITNLAAVGVVIWYS